MIFPFRRLTFLASFFLTTVIVLIVIGFEIFGRVFYFQEKGFHYGVLISIFLILITNYLMLEFLFNSYGKNQIRRLSNMIPEIKKNDKETDLNFKTLGERVSEIKEKSDTEIDTMKEMEIYRKEYIGNISHEMKTPLFSIQGYVSTLMDGAVENLDIRDRYLQRIDKSVERLLNIVQDLDMINKYESGEISLEISTFDINLLVREIVDLLEIETQKINAQISIATSKKALFVEADKQKIFQVLMNLVSNAIYYSNREKAQIIIKTESVKNKVRIEVSDNGMGIKPEILPRIFERFYRVESSRNRREGGSGLGLAIVKHILDAHQEKIKVESIYLEGTKFSFLLDKV